VLGSIHEKSEPPFPPPEGEVARRDGGGAPVLQDNAPLPAPPDSPLPVSCRALGATGCGCVHQRRILAVSYEANRKERR